MKCRMLWSASGQSMDAWTKTFRRELDQKRAEEGLSVWGRSELLEFSLGDCSFQCLARDRQRPVFQRRRNQGDIDFPNPGARVWHRRRCPCAAGKLRGAGLKRVLIRSL